ncbi:hypothetical protein BCR36DRAFT_582898, partial [Piromyces finnis]
MKSITLTLLSLIIGISCAENPINSYTPTKNININTESISCMLAIKKYGSCLYNLNDTTSLDFTSACSKFETDNCKEFLNDVYNTTTDCDGQDDDSIDSLIKQIRYVYIAGCSKDENGNLCPLTEFIQKRNDVKINTDIVNKSCSSANCKRQLHNMIELLPYTKSYVENQNNNKKNEEQIPSEWIDITYKQIDVDSLKTYLDSEVCSKVNQNNTTVNITDVNNPNPNNSTMANTNGNDESAAIFSQDKNLIFISIILIIIFN